MPCFISYNKYSPLLVFETTEVHGFNPDCSCSDCQGTGAFCVSCDWTLDACQCLGWNSAPAIYEDYEFDDTDINWEA
jgi:hypothetical protein